MHAWGRGRTINAHLVRSRRGGQSLVFRVQSLGFIFSLPSSHTKSAHAEGFFIRLCTSQYICIHARARAHTHTHTHLYTYLCICIYMYGELYTSVCVCVCVCVCAYSSPSSHTKSAHAEGFFRRLGTSHPPSRVWSQSCTHTHTQCVCVCLCV